MRPCDDGPAAARRVASRHDDHAGDGDRVAVSILRAVQNPESGSAHRRAAHRLDADDGARLAEQLADVRVIKPFRSLGRDEGREPEEKER